jgi:acyl carrier protein
MELQDFIKKIAMLFETTNISEFNEDTEFKTFDEWSSLTTLSVIAMIDDEYKITIKGRDIREAETIRDLFDIVAALKHKE